MMKFKIIRNKGIEFTCNIGRFAFQISFTDNRLYPRFHKDYIGKMYLVEWFCFAIGWIK